MADLDTIEGLKEAVQQLFTELRNTPPIGSIIFDATDGEPPQGYLLCDGTEYNLEEYPEYTQLFEKITNKYGGDGIATFIVPDVRGLFPRFFDKGRGLDVGRVIGSQQEQSTSMPAIPFEVEESGSHSHPLTGRGEHSHQFDSYHYTPDKGEGGSYWHLLNHPYRANVHGDGGHTHTIEQSGIHNHELIGGDLETRPKNISFVGYIRF